MPTESPHDLHDPGPDTHASTIGALPEPVGVILLALVSIGTLTVGNALGYSPVALVILITTGLLAAIGVRAAVKPHRLSVAFGIVKQHGGYMVAASEPGEGAEFCIYLPPGDEPDGDKSKPRREDGPP